VAVSSIGAARLRIRRDGGRCEPMLRELIERAHSPAAHAVYTRFDADVVLARARAADAKPVDLPLRGLPVSIKDLFDVEGEVTAAGSVILRAGAPARAHAPVVARLEAAGAVLAGRTNMSEFAFSGVGINPHHGTPRNRCDTTVHRIPGGSSSGAAVSVALGLAVAGLGSDTGGSLRIPAALCGLVGFKPTQSRLPRDGAFELSRTLDSIGAITSRVADAITIDGVLSGAALALQPLSLRGLRLAVPQTTVLDALDTEVARAFDAALALLRDAGAALHDVALPEFAEVAKLNAPGGFSATEAYAVHRAYFDGRRAEFDPRVAQRIEPGRHVSAADYLGLHDRRRDWIARVGAALDGFDAFVCPTVPIVAPAVQPLLDSDEAFFRVNALLLRNTFLVNYLDGCAFSLPCHAPGDLPVGLMVAGPWGSDARIASIALAIEQAIERARHSDWR
jgi:aspartyl-tRNA(Asn)/glutamyl-tRNA(Gln) amidotransferase subunit A